MQRAWTSTVLQFTMATVAAFALMAFGAAMTSRLAAQTLSADQSGEIDVAGVTRTYLIHVPKAPPPKGGYPVVLAFHGGGGRGSKMVELMNFNPYADARGFIVIYPDGLNRHWNDGRSTIKVKTDDIGFVRALLDDVRHRFPVNAKRMFAVGISNGAVFSQRVGCELSNQIAAIASVSGTMASELAASCRPSQPVSVLQISGTSDPIMPYDGGAVKQFLGAGEGGTVLSAQETIKLWARLDGCAKASPREQLPQKSRPDGTSITRQTFGDCRGSTSATLLTVQNGGHAWPGGRQWLRFMFGTTSNQLDASREIIDFFLSRPLS